VVARDVGIGVRQDRDSEHTVMCGISLYCLEVLGRDREECVCAKRGDELSPLLRRQPQSIGSSPPRQDTGQLAQQRCRSHEQKGAFTPGLQNPSGSAAILESRAYENVRVEHSLH